MSSEAAITTTVLFVGDAKKGLIWDSNLPRPRKSNFSIEPLVTISNSRMPTEKVPSSKTIRFSDISFCKRIGGSTQQNWSEAALATVDHLGNLFIFDFDSNQFWLLARVGIAGTAISIHGSDKTRELIIGFSNTSVGCYDIDTRKPIAKILQAHKFPVHHISIDPSSSLVLLTTYSDATLWDRKNWVRKRVLATNSNGIHKASFSTTGKYIFSIFKNGALTLWDSHSFECIWEYNEAIVEGQTNCFGNLTFDREDVLFAYGTNKITVMSMESHILLGQCDHESLECGIVDMKFVGGSKILLVLTVKGIMFALNIENLGEIQQLDIDLKIASFEISHDGSYLATTCVLQNSVVLIWALSSFLGKEFERDIPALTEYLDKLEDENSPELEETWDDYNPSIRTKRRAEIPLNSNAFSKPTKLSKSSESDFEKEALSNGSNQNIRSNYEDISQKSSRINGSKQSSTSSEHLTSIHISSISSSKPSQNSVNSSQFSSVLKTSYLSKEILWKYLHKQKGYPSSERLAIWKQLLEIPVDREAFENLDIKGEHPVIEKFRGLFTLKDRELGRLMERTISCLAYWSPDVLGDIKHTETLTKMIFPFVILFNAHTCETFEMLATILLNWTQGFWTDDEPPQLPLTLVDNLLQVQDPALSDHLLRNKLSPKVN
ncbi:hypothetical protein K7432_001527 [Basidiobolus ranarum]|uniref:TBC1 domain family member 31 n=1 Tax=Basidiobolus ranarum TaxID=34480 RepID=A0ABR2W9B7_9FUNG